MQVRSNKWLGLLYIAVSLLGGMVSTLAYITDGEAIYFVGFGLVSAIFFWVGVSILINKVYFIVNTSSLVLSAAIGPLKKTYRFQSLDELKVEKNKVYLIQDGKWKKLAIDYRTADRKDWDRFVLFIRHPEKPEP
jgi:hypothetical protein